MQRNIAWSAAHVVKNTSTDITTVSTTVLLDERGKLDDWTYCTQVTWMWQIDQVASHRTNRELYAKGMHEDTPAT